VVTHYKQRSDCDQKLIEASLREGSMVSVVMIDWYIPGPNRKTAHAKTTSNP